MNPKIAVIIPSYNAKNSIIKTISGVLNKVENAIVIVVDDNSPDGTARLIKRYFSYNKRVKLIIRKNKGGRGSAVIRGFKEGLKNKNLKFFIEMDADLCHNPKYIPLLIKKCNTCDVSIASKYINGSKIVGLDIKRVLFSKLVNSYLKLMLGVPITDYTNGYRCYKRSVLEKVNLNSIKAKGFITLSEIAYRIYKKGFSFGEIPFNFKSYNVNKSNFNIKEVIEALLATSRLILGG